MNPFIFVVKARAFTTEKSKYNSILPMIIFCTSCSFFVFINLLFGCEDFREKLADIKGIPHFTNEATEEILAGNKSDGIHAKIINSALK
ncbi:hypothetical protein HU186_17720 [Bacillus paralicheniformis]|nr:hypothetical protein [Bacillus paralicheniformis]